MCGICGFSWEDKKLLKDMMDILVHRGPDDSGHYTDKSASLGHRRLNIIDLSEKGRQPIHNEDNSIFVTYNGEIYNFQEIRAELEKKGHKFYSNTDTEIIVHAYEEYGEDCITHFNGMFSFALWDSEKKLFFLARDRAGIKPLYYSIKNNQLIFASEIKAILLHNNITKEIDNNSLNQYLTFRYIPGAQTIFKDVKKLLPGHTLTYQLDKKENQIEIRKFWDLKFSPKKKTTETYSKELNNTLKEAINKRLISDVPLGAFLSGGLDSTYLVGLMNELCDQPIKTFSIGFESGKGYDESKFSRLAAETYNTDHREIFVGDNSIELLPKIMWHMDEPIADFASIPTYILSEFAKKKVTVVLTGEGADEIFSGYRKYKYLKTFHPYYKSIPLILRKSLSPLFSLSNKPLIRERLKKFHSASSISEYYLQLISFFTKDEKERLINPPIANNFKEQPDLSTIKPFFNNSSIINSLMTLDFKTWLPEDILMKVDKTTMAHALEARVPFLDPNMIHLAEQIPHNKKLRFNKEKYILRQAMKNKVPKTIYKRKKHGFNVPIHEWLTKPYLKDLSQKLLSKEAVIERGLFNPRHIEKLFKNYNSSKVYYSRQLWILLNFEIWHKMVVEGDIKKPNFNINNIL
jgi:asparagine synthase (glutamine-hydrolysing)